MRVLIINTSERIGGAAIAASRLMEALKNSGIETKMLVRDKQTDQVDVIELPRSRKLIWNFVWERIVIWKANRFKKKNLFAVDIANTGTDVTRLPEFREADIINLHWINQGMLSLKNIREIIKSGKPVVWTMHDMWPCTGICHHAHSCDHFKSECKNCPFLSFPGPNDLAYKVFRKKQRVLSDAPVEIVTVSRWLANQVGQSTLLKDKHISIIPNTLSLSSFNMLDKQECRKELSLTHPYILLFGAARIDAPIKGFNTLLESLRILIAEKRFKAEDLHLVLFGKIKYPENIIPHIPVSYSNLGWITDASLLSKLYSAADVTVSASLYETFGQTLIEAQACGCLPVSFGNSGQADIIRHKENGFLAESQSAESLAEGICWGITEGQTKISKEQMREEVLSKYSGEVVANQYADLYNSLIKKAP